MVAEIQIKNDRLTFIWMLHGQMAFLRQKIRLYNHLKLMLEKYGGI